MVLPAAAASGMFAGSKKGVPDISDCEDGVGARESGDQGWFIVDVCSDDLGPFCCQGLSGGAGGVACVAAGAT